MYIVYAHIYIHKFMKLPNRVTVGGLGWVGWLLELRQWVAVVGEAWRPHMNEKDKYKFGKGINDHAKKK